MSFSSFLEAIASEIDSQNWQTEPIYRLEPVDVVFDYTPATKVSTRLMTERRGIGSSIASVVHALSDREIALKRTSRKKGQPLCGFKSTSKWGGSDWRQENEDVTCPKCLRTIDAFGLNRSIRHKRLSLWS